MDRDTMSIAMSENSINMGMTSVFKNAKLPAYFFTKDFK